MHPADQIDVLIPNFKRRLSGVTASVMRLVPLQAQMMRLRAVAPSLPAHIPQIPMRALWTLPRSGPAPSGYRVWHARRNHEMIIGLLLAKLLRKRLRFVFTAAAQRPYGALTHFLIARMDHLVATSHKNLPYLRRSATIIPHGVDTKAFHPTDDKAAARRALGLPPEGRLIGTFGRIRPKKGTDIFIRTAIRLCTAHPDLSALVMGRAAPKDADFLLGLKAEVAAAGLQARIHFLPEVGVEEIPKWYRILDLYITASLSEGFGLTPLEAMSSGVPVVAFDVGAFREVIKEGATGSVLPLGDAAGLEAAAQALLLNPAALRAAQLAARAHVAARFDIAGEAEALCAIYRHLLEI